MERKRVVKLAIECIQAEIERLSFDAEVYDRGLGDYPAARRASLRRRQLQTALASLRSQLLVDCA